MDITLDTSCFYTIEVVDPDCKNLVPRDWSISLPSSPNILSVNKISFPICEANSGQFKVPRTKNLVSSFDINTLDVGAHNITIVTFEGSILEFTLTILDLDACSLDQLGCNTLTEPVSALTLSLTPDLFLASLCDDLYQIRAPDGNWHSVLNVSRVDPEVLDVKIRHPLTETICLTSVEIIDCIDYSTVCRDTIDIFFPAVNPMYSVSTTSTNNVLIMPINSLSEVIQ
jgi:hypothetical protein